MTHTELPWAVCDDPPNPQWMKGNTIWSPSEGRRVADTCIFDGRSEINAALIVRAVNSHDALVKALEQIADIAEGSRTVNSLPHIAKVARAARSLRQSKPRCRCRSPQHDSTPRI